MARVPSNKAPCCLIAKKKGALRPGSFMVSVPGVSPFSEYLVHMPSLLYKFEPLVVAMV